MRGNAKRLVLATALLAAVIAGLAQSTAAKQVPDASGVLHNSQTTTLDSYNVEFVGQIGGPSYAVAVQGAYAYVGVGPRLVVFDIATPSQPRKVGETSVMPDLVLGIAVSGGYAYVADFSGGLRVVNVTNPASPVEVGFYDTLAYALDVAVSGGYAYVAGEGAGLRVVNVINPTSPVEVGFCDTPGDALRVAVNGAYAYVMAGGALRVVSVTNPASPVEMGFYDTPGDARAVAVSGNYAYLADGYAGLRVVSMANPAGPVEVGFYDTPGFANGVAVSGGYAYVADSNGGLRVVSVVNPASPVEEGFYDTPGLAYGVAVSGAYAYVAGEGAGLRVVNVVNPASPVEEGFYNTLGSVWGVALSGDYVYVADGMRLRVVNIVNSSNPVEVAFYETPGYAKNVAVRGNYAYLADGSAGLRVVSVANPASPFEVGFYDTPGLAYDVAVSGGYVYVTGGSALRVVNVTNPASPFEVGFYDTPGSPQDIAVSGAYAYVADGDAGLRVVSVANPASPVEVGFYDTPRFAYGVAVSDDYAYVADGYGGLRVVSVVNPASPVEVGLYDTPGLAYGVAVSGDHAYVADESRGLRVVNIGNPASPVEMGFYDTPGEAYGVALSGVYAYVADGYGGLAILRYNGDDPTPMPTTTPTSTPTPSPTLTSTPTPTATPPPGDLYEPDNTCTQAGPIASDGTTQERSFHAQADADWVRFDATIGRRYLIEAQVPPGSQADLVLEVYNSCSGPPAGSQGFTFSPNVRLEFEAATTGPIYLKLVNHQPEGFGPQVSYRLSVLALTQELLPGALILVAGRNSSTDPLQPNIHQVTDAVYSLFRNHGYGEDRIFYLATEGRPGRDGLPTVANLQAAVTAWAVDKVGPDRALTLYLMDHGTHELIYLDKPSYQWLAPAQLQQWLTQLETARPGVRINIIVEACNSGGFIDAPQTASGPGRVVITSTSPDKLAWASATGAVFSDHFLGTLGQGASLYSAFQTASWAVQTTGNPQQPWLDGNGNGIPNEPADEAEAARRGFAYAGTLADDRWPPYIAQADPIQIGADGRGRLRVEVRDDVRAQRVWALIYPPSYQPPEEQEDLVWENITSVNLFREGVTDWFSTIQPGFNERGRYRVVFNAEDGERLNARPLTVYARNGGVIYLPLIVR